MLKRFYLNRILKMTLFLFIFFLLCLYPKSNRYELKTSSVIGGNYHDIFLIDSNNYVSKTTIAVSSIEKEKLAKDLLCSLITTKAHVANILQKLEVDDRLQAALKALKYKK